MTRVIQTFRGFSGNQIYLMEGSHGLFVRKIGNVQRNVERLTALSIDFLVPKIYDVSENTLDMEYIHGLDIKTYLKSHQPDRLVNFLLESLAKLTKTTTKDYTEVYANKLQGVDFSLLPFDQAELLSKLPKTFTQSNYFGDLTLENIIYTEDRGFYLIDCATIEYDSYVFDIAKLRQDLECHWFIRNDNIMLDVKTNYIQRKILDQYPEADNNYILLMMLLRVFKYAESLSQEQKFLIEGIKRLWK